MTHAPAEEPSRLAKAISAWTHRLGRVPDPKEEAAFVAGFEAGKKRMRPTIAAMASEKYGGAPLTKRTEKILEEHGIATVEALLALNPWDVIGWPRAGAPTAKMIADAQAFLRNRA